MPVTLPPPSALSGQIQNYNAAIQQGNQVYLQVQLPGQAAVPLGYATQLSENDDYGSEGFYGLGNIEPYEIQPLQFRGQLTITGAKLYTASWLGTLFGNAKYILQSGVLNIQVYNMVTKQVEITYVGFVAQNFSATYAANAYTIQSATGLYRTSIVPGQTSS